MLPLPKRLPRHAPSSPAAGDLRPSAALRLRDVEFAYAGGQAVFCQLNLSVAPGEVVALTGPSGCGKSTLLNLLAGFLAPDAGSVQIHEHQAYPEMSQLGYVFQSPQLFPWLNTLENVRFGLRMAGVLSAAAQHAQAKRYLSLVGLSDAAHKWPHELSGGMRQRVSLARALAPEPALLLADEPFSALDALGRRRMNEALLQRCGELGQTLIVVTHDIDEAVFMADRIVTLGLAPQGIAGELAIDLPRPRRWHPTTALPQFAQYRKQLLARFGHTSIAPI